MCKECCKPLCDVHVLDHKRRTALKSHQLFPLSEGIHLIKETKSIKKRMCDRHHQEELKLFCETCDQVICRDCTFDTHRNHSCVLITAAAEQQSKEVMMLLERASQSSQGMKELLEKVKKQKDDVQQSSKKAMQQINACFDSLIAVVERRRNQLLQEVKEKEQHACKQLKAQQSTVESLLACCQAKHKSDDDGHGKEKEKEDVVELLQMKKYLIHSCKQLEETLASPHPLCIQSLISFDPTSSVAVSNQVILSSLPSSFFSLHSYLANILYRWKELGKWKVETNNNLFKKLTFRTNGCW